VVGGPLSNNKGINKAGGGLTAPALTAKDMEDIKTAMSFQCEFLAVSFPKSATDMEMARQLANVAGEAWRHKPQLVAKIERSEAIPALEAILKASDGIMVARGDLAVEVGNAAVPALQKRMIRMARELDRFTITATQMMESMIVSTIPTRAEVSDVANAVMDGSDAVMLSAETASGKHPNKVVEAMAQIIEGAEKYQGAHVRIRQRTSGYYERTNEAIAAAVMYTANHLHVKAIVALTESGETALWMSRVRSDIPIYAFTRHETTRSRVTLYRGVYPVAYDVADEDRGSFYITIFRQMLDLKLVKDGDLIILTKGEHSGVAGGTNSMQILQVTRQ
jgi:pyruvate kinase